MANEVATSNVVQMPDVKARLPMTQGARARGITSAQWRVLTDQTFPSAKTAEAIELAIDYCVARNLDVFKKPVHIVPMWNNALRREVETIWPGINEVQITAARTGQWAGMDSPKWGPMITETFSGFKVEYKNGNRNTIPTSVEITYPEWCEVTVHRLIGGQPRAFCEPVYWKEAYSTSGGRGSLLPTDMWVKRPRGQLHKVAKAASLRAAFPEEGELTAEEMEGKVTEAGGVVIDHEPSAGQIEHSAEPEIDVEKVKSDVAEKISAVKDLVALDDLWRGGMNARIREVGTIDKKAQQEMIAAFSAKKNEILKASQPDQDGVDMSDAIPAAAIEHEPQHEAPQKPVQAGKTAAATERRDHIDNALDELRRGDKSIPEPVAIKVTVGADGSKNWSAFFNAAKAVFREAVDGEYGEDWLARWLDANGEALVELKQANKVADDKLAGMYAQAKDYFVGLRKEAEAEATKEFPTLNVGVIAIDGDEDNTVPNWPAFVRNLHAYLDDTPNHRVAEAWWKRHKVQVSYMAKAGEIERGVTGEQAAAEFTKALFARFPQIAD